MFEVCALACDCRVDKVHIQCTGFVQSRAYRAVASQGSGYGGKFCDHCGNDPLKPSMKSNKTNELHICKDSNCVVLSGAEAGIPGIRVSGKKQNLGRKGWDWD